MERADRPGFWQSVTGSQHVGESLRETALRELREETGLDARERSLSDWGMSNVYEIFPIWRHRYPPGTTQNTEHAFGLCLPGQIDVKLAPREHIAYLWLPWQQAAEKVFSWTNRDAILTLPRRMVCAAAD